VTTPDYQQALGRKIAAERRRRGLSQPELARIIGRSVAWVSQVERGVRKVDRMSVLENVAAALDVPLAELAAEAPVVAAVTEEPPDARGLRLVLSGAHALRAMLDGRGSHAISTLRAKSRKAWDLTHAGRYTDLTDLLRGLVPDLETTARTAGEPQRAEVFELMAATYQACLAALAKLGEPEAAWIAADRAMAAAERAGNPMLVAAGAFRLVFVFLAARHYDQAEETARTAAAALQLRAGQGDPQAMSLCGALTLQRAVIASRVNDPDAAYDHLERARQVAMRLGDGRNDYNTEFSPANVGLYEIAVAVELGDAGRALRVAATVGTTELSAERRARMLIDMARAYAQRRQVNEAVVALRQAEDITPEQGHGHELVGQLVSDLLIMQVPPSSELRALARRVGAARLSV
jgi:transcriptional regulator with XRE-family HTH domain